MHLPDTFIETVHRVFGDKGQAWLPQLPDIMAQCREKWHLAEGVPSPHMSMNYIELTKSADGSPVALKVGVPHSELFTEMEALALYHGRRAVRLLDADRDLGAILMQQVRPGKMLLDYNGNREQTEIAASIMRELIVPVPEGHTLPTFAQWVERAFRLTRTEWDPEERMPRDMLDHAERAFEEILRAEEDIMLHGDLHHENILHDDRDGWLAIDPKGVIGPPCMQTARYLLNFISLDLPGETQEKMIRERIAVFSDVLGYPPALIAACGFVDIVLGHCWGFEETELTPYWDQNMVQIRMLERMLDE